MTRNDGPSLVDLVLAAAALALLGKGLALELLEVVAGAGGLADAVADVAAADEAEHDAGADDEGQDEAVAAVPRRHPAAHRRRAVDRVEHDERQELRDERVLDRHEDRGPGDGRRDDADRVALVALRPAVLGPLETPVDGAEEGDDLSWAVSGGTSKRELLAGAWRSRRMGTYDGAVADLQRF